MSKKNMCDLCLTTKYGCRLYPTTLLGVIMVCEECLVRVKGFEKETVELKMEVMRE